MCERYIDQLPLAQPKLGTWPITQARALTGSQTSNLWICRSALNSLLHTSQGIPPTFCNNNNNWGRKVNVEVLWLTTKSTNSSLEEDPYEDVVGVIFSPILLNVYVLLSRIRGTRNITWGAVLLTLAPLAAGWGREGLQTHCVRNTRAGAPSPLPLAGGR